jgi:hypothetical protein
MKTTLLLAITFGLLLAGCEKNRLDVQVKELCAKDGGIKVHETVKLPPDRFDQHGTVRIPSRQDAKPSDEYYFESETSYFKQGNPDMRRSHDKIIRRSDGKVLGEFVYYARRGGDMPGPWHESSFGCPDLRTLPNFENSIFVLTTTFLGSLTISAKTLPSKANVPLSIPIENLL